MRFCSWGRLDVRSTPRPIVREMLSRMWTRATQDIGRQEKMLDSCGQPGPFIPIGAHWSSVCTCPDKDAKFQGQHSEKEREHSED